MAFDFEPSIILETAPQLLGGMKLTLIITLGGLLVGLLLGVVTGLANTSRSRFLRGIAILYIEAIRGTPLIVQVMFLYFGLPLALGMRIPPDVAGVIAIGVNSGAYIAEIVRGAIQSIDKGQTEAGRSTGLTQAQTMLYIIWPQAFRRMIPPLTNQCIISLKDTSLLVVIGVGELTRQGQEIIAVNFRAFEVWLTVAIFYLAMTLSISAVLRYYERKLMIGRRAVPASLLGVVTGLANTSRSRFLRGIAILYIEAIRGTPLIVQVMFLYFGLPLALGMRIPPDVAGVIAIGVNSGAYIAEIVRGAIQSIDKGQTEAGRSTGLTQAQTMLYIIWPQAFRRMIPPLTNQCIISLKDTSLLVVIGVGELTRQGQEIIAVNFRAFEVWLTVAIFYLAMTLSISAVLRYYERKLMIGRRAVPASPSDPQM